jgi:hypothetical protein
MMNYRTGTQDTGKNNFLLQENHLHTLHQCGEQQGIVDLSKAP